MNGTLQISVFAIFGVLAAYFGLLVAIALWMGRKENSGNNQDFFIASNSSPWYVVAYGMIGASLSGVTFISIPGVVGAAKTNQAFSYMQVVMGYFIGYLIIANILLPLYYRLNLISIYGYLKQRFGVYSYKTGAVLFLISRSIGSAFRLYLVVLVMDMLFKAGGLEIPFLLTTIVAVALIWVYTYKSGLKLIVWTDTLQTTFMLLSVVLTIVFLISKLNYSSEDIWTKLSSAGLTKCFYFEDGWSNPNNFFKQFLGGMFITIVMTGLDQDMMQKNLSCRNLKDAKKNMYSFSFVLIMVNFLFLFLGALLYLYMSEFDISIPQKIVNGESKPAFDLVFPNLAMGYLPYYIGVVFIVGLVAAAYSTADSGLTALTTSFCIDILNIDVKDNSKKNLAKRQYVHFAMSVLLCLMIFGFWLVNDDSVINQLFVIAGYTYGPLLGLFMFGLFCKRSLKDRFVPVVCASSPLFTFILNHYSTQLLYGYKFGFELLLINGLITYFGLFIISFKDSNFVKN